MHLKSKIFIIVNLMLSAYPFYIQIAVKCIQGCFLAIKAKPSQLWLPSDFSIKLDDIVQNRYFRIVAG